MKVKSNEWALYNQISPLSALKINPKSKNPSFKPHFKVISKMTIRN